MANDITSLTNGRTQQPGKSQVQDITQETRSNQSRSDSGSNSASSDKVSLTNTAAKLKALEQKLASQPDVDMNKVSEVQKAIADGKYNVNPEHVADKMMSFEKNF